MIGRRVQGVSKAANANRNNDEEENPLSGFTAAPSCPLLPAQAQQPTKVPRIGYLSAPPFRFHGRLEAFRQGLRELGYVEGKNIVIEWRHAEGKLDRLPALAAELVRLKVDVIVTAGPQQPVPPRKRLYDSHCHGAGYRSCWKWIRRQPGATWRKHHGIVTLAPELSGKQLEVLKETVPRLSRVAVFGLQPTRATHKS